VQTSPAATLPRVVRSTAQCEPCTQLPAAVFYCLVHCAAAVRVMCVCLTWHHHRPLLHHLLLALLRRRLRVRMTSSAAVHVAGGCRRMQQRGSSSTHAAHTHGHTRVQRRQSAHGHGRRRQASTLRGAAQQLRRHRRARLGCEGGSGRLRGIGCRGKELTDERYSNALRLQAMHMRCKVETSRQTIFFLLLLHSVSSPSPCSSHSSYISHSQ